MVDGRVHIPMVGDVKKTWALAGGATVVVIVGVAYYRHRNASNSTTTTGSAVSSPSSVTGYTGAADPYPADGTQGNPNDPNSMDPATGQTYGDEQAGAGGTGGMYGSTSPDQYDPYAASNYGGYYTGSYMQNNPNINSTITTNEEWLTQAENDLQGVGYDPATASAALSKVLAGLSVTEQQAQIFQQALGILGNPPQGYPTPIKISVATGGTGQYTVPNVVGMSLRDAAQAISQAHLHPHGPPVNNNEVQTVTAQSPSPGAKVNAGTTVNVTVKTSGGATGTVTVPNVVSMSLSQAAATIQGAGLHPHGPPINNKVHQTVTGQTPRAGSKVKGGSTVTVTVRTTK